MKNTTMNAVKNQIKELAEHCNVDLTDYITDYINDEQVQNFLDGDTNTIKELLQQAIYESDIVYYSRAMRYLEQGARLDQALEYAYDFGYDLKDMTAETLANIHRVEEEITALYEFMYELEELYEEIAEEEEEEEEEL